MRESGLHRRWLVPVALLLATWLFALTTSTPSSPAGDGRIAAGDQPPSWLLPLDDAYIFIRFAQQLARGESLRWTDELSSGATSPAFLVLALPGQWLADDLPGWSRWSWWVGLATLWALGLACVRLFRTFGTPEPWPLVAGLTAVLSGPVGFGALAGMESALNAAAIALACALWWEAGRAEASPRAAAHALLAVSLLPLFRPENSVLAGVAFLALLVGLGPPVRRRLAPLVLLPGLALAALNWAMTGESKPAGAIVKSITEYAFLDAGTLSAAYWFNLSQRVLTVYAGLVPRLLPGPVGWLAAGTVVALVALLLRGRRRRGLGALAVVATVWLTLLLLAPLSSMVRWQQMRHHHAGLVLAWMLALAGLALGLERLAAVRRWNPRWRLAIWLLPVLLLAGLPGWAHAYQETRKEIHRRPGPAADYLAARADKPVLMVNDAGLLAVAHDGPAVDVIGLGSPAFGRPHRHGPGAVAEQLARHHLTPTVAAVNLDIFDLPQLLGRPLLPRPEKEADTVLAEVRASLLEATALPGVGLDFAYLPDERRHEVRWSIEPSSLDPSFAVILPEPGREGTLQGCRPVPESVRWRDAEVAVVPTAGATKGGEALAHARIPAGSWRDLEVRLPAANGSLMLVRLSGGMPCVESVAFSVSPSAAAPRAGRR